MKGFYSDYKGKLNALLLKQNETFKIFNKKKEVLRQILFKSQLYDQKDAIKMSQQKLYFLLLDRQYPAQHNQLNHIVSKFSFSRNLYENIAFIFLSGCADPIYIFSTGQITIFLIFLFQEILMNKS